MIPISLLNRCLNSVTEEIKSFQTDITFLKERLLITQRLIRTLYSLPYYKELDSEIRKVLTDNKHMLKKLKEDTKLHSELEYALGQLNNDKDRGYFPLKKDLTYIIKHFEDTENYENCAIFKTLLDSSLTLNFKMV